MGIVKLNVIKPAKPLNMARRELERQNAQARPFWMKGKNKNGK